MGKKILEFLEKYIDKLIMGVIGIICLAMLWFFVLSNPYAVKYQGRKVGPGQLDKKIREQARRLEDKIKEPPVYPSERQTKVSLYKEKLALSFDGFDSGAFAALPGMKDITPLDDRSYKAPKIPDIAGVDVEWYRAVVHAPTDVVDVANRYEMVPTEYKDIDIVSVQGTFDMEALQKSFQSSFDSPLFAAKYRSEKLATPLFADVQLERQQLTENGWTEWQVLPRTKVDPFTKIISQVPAKITEEHIGGIDILMANYNGPDIQMGIVQPEVYEFASNIDLWLPPTLHDEYQKLFDKQADIDREASRRREKEMGRNRLRSKRGAGGGFDPMMGGPDMGTSRTTRRTKRTDPKAEVARTIKDVTEDFDKEKLTDQDNLGIRKLPLTIWASDDTVEVEKTYRYRIRLGVFNPTAGKGWLQEAEFADSVVLWSEYSEITDQITIDPMIYFFPLDLAKNKSSVSVQVSKFYMGNWRSHRFDVIPGQYIGFEVELEEKEKKVATGMEDMMMGLNPMGDDNQGPMIVDFNTEMLMVDVIKMSDWVGSSMLRMRNYSDVLYTEDGINIARIPTKKTNWPKLLKTKFDRIRNAHELYVHLTPRGSGAGGYMDGGFQGDPMMDPGMDPFLMMDGF